MADTVKFSCNLGSMEIDFDNKKVLLERTGAIAQQLNLPSMAFNFADITDVEMKPAKMLTVPEISFILKGNRLMTSKGSDATRFTVNKSDEKNAKTTLEKLIKECNLSGIKELNRKDVPKKRYSGEYDSDSEKLMKKIQNFISEDSKRETRKVCNVCGHIFCYNQADIDKNKSNARNATLSSVAGIAGALGGAYTASAVNNNNANNRLNQIVDFNRCPQCNSTNLSIISDEEFQKMQEQKQAPQSSAPAVSVADELKKFKELLDMGAISQEEYDQKKKELLDL